MTILAFLSDLLAHRSITLIVSFYLLTHPPVNPRCALSVSMDCTGEGPLPRSERALESGAPRSSIMWLGGVPGGPQPLMRRDEAIQGPSPIAIQVRGMAGHHYLPKPQQVFCPFGVTLIGRGVEGGEGLVRKPTE